MLLPKLIKVAFILKDLDLSQFFSNKESIDVQGLIKHLETIDSSIVIELAKVVTDDKSKSVDNEVDALLGLTAFFLPLVEQVRTSPHLPKVLSLTSLLSSTKNPV